MEELPIIDVGPLLGRQGNWRAVGEAIDAACSSVGFFYVVGHGVDEGLQESLDELAREFFALPEAEKRSVAMDRGGPAWRGWFPLGGELTSGVPDLKEGLYFGSELPPDDPRVASGRPLHGPNLFPVRPGGLREVVLAYLDEMTRLAQAILGGIALGLGLDRDWFLRNLTDDPLVLFRIFRYPPVQSEGDGWGVAEHTDYGLLTILGQDPHGGLQVRGPAGWIDAPPVPGSFVCNLGDMLERLTGGRYRSTPHRVRNTSGAERLSFPFFLDPSWDAIVDRLPIVERPADDDGAAQRWDRTSVHGFTGTYGEYIMSKVAKVFPDLAAGTGSV